MSSLTTISFFRFKTISSKAWAFLQMGNMPGRLTRTEGQTFFKLMGSGKGRGFNPWPDWGTYCLLQTWKSEEYADSFFNSTLFYNYNSKTHENWTLYMRPTQSKGEWDGSNPFKITSITTDDGPLAVLTRATIKKRFLFQFWKYVPTSEKPLDYNQGLIFTKGVGEVPVIQMATFSLWSDQNSLNSFAYKSPEHMKAIRHTRELGWYREELFARFKIFRSEGTWQGKDPVATYLGK